MGNFIEGQGLIVLSQDILVDVLESRQMWKVLYGFWGYIKLFTYSVDLVSGMMMPWLTIYSNLSSSLTGALLGPFFEHDVSV